MKQFFSVLRFELAGYFKNKIYMGMTLAFVLIVAGVLSFPTVKGLFASGDGGGEPVQAADAGPRLAVVNENGALSGDALQFFMASLPGYQAAEAEGDEASIREQVAKGEYDGAVFVKSGGELTYVARNLGLYDSPEALFSQAFAEAWRVDRLTALGISAQEIPQILAPPVSVSVENLGVSQMDTFFYTYALIFALYMAIIIYGQLVATAVATEKSTRTMELLITSARPNSLLFGKVIGSGLAGLCQMAAIFGSAVLFYHINAASWAGNAVIASIFNMPLPILGFALLFFVLGYFLYSFLYGALGSLASRTEDVNTSILPLTFGYIIAFMVVMMSMASGNVDNAAMKFCSFLPFTSPMAMFTRIAMSSPAWYEIIASIALLIVTMAGAGLLSARIYRLGVLMYGKPPKLTEVIRILRAARKARA